jgi:hypothetical protein
MPSGYDPRVGLRGALDEGGSRTHCRVRFNASAASAESRQDFSWNLPAR